MYRVYGYIVDGGDGSHSISWLDELLTEDEVDNSDYGDYLRDGDGITHRATLTFESKSAAEAVGIYVQEKTDLLE